MRGRRLAGLLIAAVSSVCDAQERSRPVTPADYRIRPPASLIARLYPDRAQRMEVSGRATIDCRITPAGRMEDCAVISESPEQYGFGPSAIKISEWIGLVPPTKAEVREGLTRRTMTMTFEVPYEPPLTLPPAADR
jgi:protein TonB